MALIRSNKKVTIAYLHRNMIEYHQRLQKELELSNQPIISYSQLKRILQTTDYEQINKINSEYFAYQIQTEKGEWYAIDGKELRGTIDKSSGAKRGENIVTRVNHEDSTTSVIGYYNGKKDSERNLVKGYMDSFEKLKGKYTMDALHNSSDFVKEIDKKGGTYLVAINDNQHNLLQDCKDLVEYDVSDYQCNNSRKGHGRVEIRKSKGYELFPKLFDQRWNETGIASLIVIDKEIYNCKKGKSSFETCYWISNKALTKESFPELVTAIQQHWQIETNHYIRDVQFGEDQLLNSKQNESRLLSSFLSLTMNLFKKEPNRSVLRDKLVHDTKFKLTKSLLKKALSTKNKS